MHKWIIGVCLAVVVAVVLAFPLNDERGLRLGGEGHIHTLDPARMTWLQDIRIAGGLFEGLTTYDPDTLAPAPGVAESWTVSPDGLTYTFHLRRDACWSNGDPVVAGDFAYAWKRALHPALSADYTYLLWTISNARRYTEGLSEGGTPIDFAEVGVKAADEHTLVVTLERPCSFFLELTGFATFSPVHPPSCRRFRQPTGAWDPAWTEPQNLVCNGAFVLEKHLFQQRVVLGRNDRYWDRDHVASRRIIFDEVENPKTAFLKYETGELDAITSVPAGEAQDLLRNPARNGVDFFAFPAFGTYFYRFNCTRPPFDDRRVRQAFSMATDKRRITEVVTRTGETPTDCFVAPGTPHYSSPAGLRYDPAKARALLAEAGHPGGAGLGPVEILFNTSEDHRRIATAIGQIWKENLGVDVKLSNQESRVFGESMRNLRYTVCRAGWFGDYGDATTFLDMFQTGNGNNETGYSNPGYDGLIRQAAAEPDAGKRAALLQRAEAVLLDDAPILPIYHYVNKYMVRPSVRGLRRNSRNIIVLKYLSKAEG